MQRSGGVGTYRIPRCSQAGFGPRGPIHWLHIEQGPVLEKENIKIGVVERVQGIYWTEYVLGGQAAHAGTTPLVLRRDPGLLASRINIVIRQLAEEITGQLGTIGLMEFHPNVINVVPEQVRMVSDLRNPDNSRLMAAQKRLDEFVKTEAAAWNISVGRTELVRLAPVEFHPELLISSSKRQPGWGLHRVVWSVVQVTTPK